MHELSWKKRYSSTRGDDCGPPMSSVRGLFGGDARMA
jgi:hypothetical protein